MAQSSFTMHQFWCPKRHAMNNLDEILRSHPSQAYIPTPPPLAQARLRSQKSGQNGGSTPTPCLDKAVHPRDTCDSQTGNNIVSQG